MPVSVGLCVRLLFKSAMAQSPEKGSDISAYLRRAFHFQKVVYLTQFI